jgi:hypothetical protein
MAHFHWFEHGSKVQLILTLKFLSLLVGVESIITVSEAGIIRLPLFLLGPKWLGSSQLFHAFLEFTVLTGFSRQQ